MRVSGSLLVAGLLICGAGIGGVALAADEVPLTPQPNVAPSLSAIPPVNPAASRPGGPVITAITVRMGPQILNVVSQNISPEFHFTAPNGNAVLLHRDIVSGNGENNNLNQNTLINTPADAQKSGAVVSSGWNCSADAHRITFKAFILDLDGNRSNTVQYTVHCNGG